MKNLNLGCGNKFHPDWINVDMYPADESVLRCNFLNGLPFQSNYFDVVYHSHVLEHFNAAKGKELIKECFRVLQPKGIIRVVLPDLEKIVNEYKRNLSRIDNNEENAQWDYDWILLEMYDQTVRNENGGEMLRYLKDERIKNRAYVNFRIGLEYTYSQPLKTVSKTIKEEIESLKNEINQKEKYNLLFKIFQKLKTAKNKICIALLSDDERENLRIGQFRNNGEIHQWMYDRFSAKRLLQDCGFIEVKIRTAEESYINSWPSFNLDNPDENASLFIEGIKP